MALRIWLPLNGDLENKGISDYSITSLGTLSWVDGKISKNAMRAGDGTQIINGLKLDTNFINLLNGDYSISVWIKPYGTHVHYNGSIFSSGNWNTANKRWSFGVSQDNSKVDVLCMNYNTYIACPIPENIWTNIICARGSDNIVRLYKNGEYIGSKDCSSDPAFDSDYNYSCIGRESYANGYFSFNGAINDFRLYDHCLSEKEIKEISQGLILHYKLDNQFSGIGNLLENGDGSQETAYWTNAIISNDIPSNSNAKVSFKNGTHTQYIPIITNHSYTVSAYAKTAGAESGNWYPSIYPYDIDKKFIYHYNTPDGFQLATRTTLSQTLNPGDTVVHATSLASWPTHTNSRYVAIFSYIDSTGYKYPDWFYTQNVKAYGTSSNLDLTNNTITLSAAYNGPVVPAGTSICQSVAGSTNYYPWGNVKLENIQDWTFKTATIIPQEKNRLKAATYFRWSNYSASGLLNDIRIVDNTFQSDIIKDSSGYENNGTQNNTVISQNTPRYNYSAIFNGTDSYIKVLANNWMSQGMEALTVNLWAKATTWPTNGGRLLSCTETGGFNLEGGSSGYWRFPIHAYTNAEKTSTAYKYDSKEIQISALTPNDWNMITLVYDTTGTKTYINGQLHHTYTNTSYGIHFNTNARLFLGCEANTANPGGNYFNGQESDFRLYITALSAEDILDLYHTPTNINNLGGVHAFEFIEDTSARELLALPWTSAYSTHNKTSISTNYNDKHEWYSNTNSSAGSDYIKINPTGNTYYYDTEISVAAGNQFYIGFERYDENKTLRSNNACVYIVSIKPTSDIIHQRYFGTVNLATDGVNPTDTIALRVLNAWSGTTSGSTKEGTIHYLSLREVSGKPQTGKIKQQGQIYTDEFVEREKQASIYENGFVGGNTIIEK